MLPLLSLTFVTGFTDSFNPFGIVQQFTLQGLLKKREDIWYYIWTMFATNYVAGLIFYSAIVFLSDQVIGKYWSALETPLRIGAIVVGLVLVWYGIRSFLINWKARKNILKRAAEEAEELEGKLSGKTWTKSSLISVGFFTTIMELTTAAPYFAYLTLVQQFQLRLPQLLLILVFYNLLYSLPLFVLYFLSVFFEAAFNRIYERLNKVLQLVSAFLVPVILLILAGILLVFGIF